MTTPAERTLGTTIRDIGGNVDRIVRGEMQLAVAELDLRVEAFQSESVRLMTGVVAAALAATFFLLGGMFGLAHMMPLWCSAILVAALPAAIAARLYVQVRGQRARRLASKPQPIHSIPRRVP